MSHVTVLPGTANALMDGICGGFNIQRFASLHRIGCCLVMVKQSNNFPIKQAYLWSISQTNNVKSVSQTVNTNRPHYLDCLTVDRPALFLSQTTIDPTFFFASTLLSHVAFITMHSAFSQLLPALKSFAKSLFRVLPSFTS